MRVLIASILLFFQIGCGVKGDPLPPEEPAYIGRGEPNFRKGVQRFDIRTEEIESEKEILKEEEEEEDE